MGYPRRCRRNALAHQTTCRLPNQPDSDWNPTARLEDWLEAAARLRPTATETVWLQVTRGDTVTRDAPITAAAINNVVQRRASPAGLENPLGYSAHSLRPGLSPKPRTGGSTRPTSCATPGTRASRSCAGYDRTSGLWIRNATTTGLRQAIRRQHQIGLGMAEPSHVGHPCTARGRTGRTV